MYYRTVRLTVWLSEMEKYELPEKIVIDSKLKTLSCSLVRMVREAELRIRGIVIYADPFHRLFY